MKEDWGEEDKGVGREGNWEDLQTMRRRKGGNGEK